MMKCSQRLHNSSNRALVNRNKQHKWLKMPLMNWMMIFRFSSPK